MSKENSCTCADIKHHTTSHRILKANFTWNIQDWQWSAEYIRNKRENEQMALMSPHFHTEQGMVLCLTMIFTKKTDYQHSQVCFNCCCVSKPIYNPNEDCLEIRGTVQIITDKNKALYAFDIDAFITQSQIWKSWFINSQNLTKSIKIEANLLIGGWKTNREGLAPKVRAPELPSLLASSTEFSDVTVVVEGQEVPAHKAVLAVRSPVLRAMLSAEMKEKQESRILLDDVSVAAWRIFQQFLYKDYLDCSSTLDLPLLTELLMLSDKYQVKALRDDVEANILRFMTVENVFEIAASVEKFNVSGLNEKASDIIKENWDILRKKPCFITWLISGSSLAKVLLGKLHL